MAQKTLTKLLKKTVLISYFLLTSLNNYAAFLDDQLLFSRVKQAYDEKITILTEKLEAHQLKSNDFYIMFKIYKYEKMLRVYVRKKTGHEWLLFASYPFCASGATPGSKIIKSDVYTISGICRSFYS